MNDEEILDLFSKNYDDFDYAEVIIRVYLNRAKSQNDTIKIARAYDRLTWLFSPEKNIAYADSIIQLTKKMKNKTYPGLGYLIKGGELVELRDYRSALDNFLTAFYFANINKNEIHLIYLEKRIIEIIRVWGDPLEAISRSEKLLDKIKSIDYEQMLKENSRPSLTISKAVVDYHYLTDIIETNQALTTSYLANRNYLKAKNINKENLNIIVDNGLSEFIDSNRYRYGELAYYEGNYLTSIDTLKKYKMYNSNPNTLLNSNYYIGMSYMKLDSLDKSVDYFLAADSIFELNKVIMPTQKALFKQLSRYYDRNGDIKNQLKYINKQIYVDSMFKDIYASINSEIVRDYDTPRLIAQKEALIAQLEEEKSFLSKKAAWILGLLILSMASIPFFIVRQRKLKKRFDALIKSMDSEVKKIPKPATKSSLSSEVIDDIMEKLQRFEDQQKYLSGTVSLQGVAKSFNTNSSYLSKVVNLHKDKNFSQYLNDLRIDYAIKELTNNAKFRRYTIKAIAQDVGFGNSQSFSKAFHSKTGLQPSYFVRKLNKQAS